MHCGGGELDGFANRDAPLAGFDTGNRAVVPAVPGCGHRIGELLLGDLRLPPKLAQLRPKMMSGCPFRLTSALTAIPGWSAGHLLAVAGEPTSKERLVGRLAADAAPSGTAWACLRYLGWFWLRLA
jgi:hypothetical protein